MEGRMTLSTDQSSENVIEWTYSLHINTEFFMQICAKTELLFLFFSFHMEPSSFATYYVYYINWLTTIDFSFQRY